jgi:hypothetical protein
MPTIKLVKKSAQKKPAARAAAGAPAVDFVLQDNGDDTCTVLGVDAAGNSLDISGVASLTPAPTSSDTTVLTVDAPIGMTFAMHAVGKLSTPGTPVVVTAVAAWTDGSKGPFTVTLPVDVTAGPAGGVVIVPGVPTLR